MTQGIAQAARRVAAALGFVVATVIIVLALGALHRERSGPLAPTSPGPVRPASSSHAVGAKPSALG
jgi:hypothetical protein